MGWNVETKNINGENKYKIWTTVSDKFITKDWLSKDEILKFLFWHRFEKFVDSFLEDAIQFPNEWCNKKGERYMDDEKSEEYFEFRKKTIKDDDLFYNRFIEEINKLGIKLSINDGESEINNL